MSAEVSAPKLSLEDVPKELRQRWAEEETARLKAKLRKWGKVPRADALVLTYALRRRMDEWIGLSPEEAEFYSKPSTPEAVENAHQSATKGAAGPIGGESRPRAPADLVEQCRALQNAVEIVRCAADGRSMAIAINKGCRAVGLNRPIWHPDDGNKLHSALIAMGVIPVLRTYIKLAWAKVPHPELMKRLRNATEYSEATDWLPTVKLEEQAQRWDVPECWRMHPGLAKAITDAVSAQVYGPGWEG